MTYQSSEESIAAGKPILLFDFAAATGEHWRMTTSEDTVTFMSHDYDPGVVSHREIEIGDYPDVNAVEVNLGRSQPLANQFIAAPVEGIVTLTLYRGHDGNYIVYWWGLLTSVKFGTDGIPSLRFEPRTSSFLRLGNRRCNQRLCDHALYDSGCRVNNTSYQVAGTISNISGLDITASIFSTKSNGWFVGGQLVVGYARRLIKAHTTNVVTVTRVMQDAAIGNSLLAFAGCDHTPTTCNTKFSNKLNFGGNEFLPVKDPFKAGIKY
jgi:uncharacterized phage protein (TIGR02218 family)